jgi:hypothetical protein
MWWMAVSAALQMYSANEANDKAKVANSIRKAEADATNRIRDTRNGVNIAVDKLNRWVQSNNNNLRMKSAASALEANTTNAARRSDERTTQRFQSAIQRAETLGAQQAAVGLSGVSGPVTDMIAGSIALRDSIVAEGLRKQGVSEDFDTARRAGAIMSQMVNGLDNSILTPMIDHNTATPDLLHEKSGTGMFAPILLNSASQMGSSLQSSTGNATGTPDRAPEKFQFETSVSPGADDPFSFWVSQ